MTQIPVYSPSMERRNFLAATTALSAQRVLGANDKIRGGIIGSGGRGRYHIAQFKEIGVEMAAVCDIYEGNLNEGIKIASTGAKPYENYKKMLADKSLDVVIVATPDHWHAQMTIDAVEAGKDVYVEKPMAHTTEDGFRMIDAVRRTNRIVQVGTQRRSAEQFLEAKKVMDSGALGDVRLVNSWWVNSTGPTFGKREPKGKIDWKQWLGAAPNRAYDPKIQFNWYWYFDYSGGLLIGQAAHIVDCINWFMNSTYPLAVTATGTKPMIEGAEVPETATMSIEHPNYLGVFTLGYKAMRYNVHNDQMKQFHGSKARFDVGRESYALYPQQDSIEIKPSVNVSKPGSFEASTRQHIRNFLECTRTRNQPNAPVQAGQYTNVVMCMAMESLKRGRRMKWDAQARRMTEA